MDIVQHKLECQTKCAFVPNFLKLHPDQGLFIAADDKGLVQCFDIALSPIRLENNQLYSGPKLAQNQLKGPLLEKLNVAFTASIHRYSM